MRNFLLVFCGLATLSLSACNNGGSSSTTSTGTTPTATATTANIKRIVSVGAGINYNNLTGGQVEMALNPSTHVPSVIYYDRTQQVVPGAPAGASTPAPPGAAPAGGSGDGSTTAAAATSADEFEDEHLIDLSQLEDATDVSTSGVDKVIQAFPGAALIDEEN